MNIKITLTNKETILILNSLSYVIDFSSCDGFKKQANKIYKKIKKARAICFKKANPSR